MEVILSSTPLFLTGVFILGLLVGSFLNVVILRLPVRLEYEWRCQCRELMGLSTKADKKPENIVTGRSRCPSCGHTIRAWENIPLLSYILLKGRCSTCNQLISWRYPVIEFLTGLLFVLTAWHFGPSLQCLTALVLTAFLIASAGIDLDTQLLPDNLTLPLMWGGIVLSLWAIHVEIVASVVGAATGYLTLWTIYQVFRLLTGKEGMGYGDFKLMAALGAWVGWQMLPMVILLSSVLGALTGLVLMGLGKLERENPLPFGPFIALSGWVVLIYGQDLLAVYSGATPFG